MSTRGGMTFAQALRARPMFQGQFDNIYHYRKGDHPMEMRDIPKSSNIAAIGYDPDTKELHVKFKSGATHAYAGVTAEEHEKLVGAESVGSHFHKHIRSKDSRRVE